ncbi:Gfo/Idh/MocA family oxidoreductase [Krasilnikoviella flava]|uniref:Predicted dehydrogenase n=1 Tax=Krasilnikoviella flava TaxID=526729 RepID=A0A1T5LAP4_9MICO|nr:oxidoreductase [Krasilnikoviella flava]SKC72729.1 Predicted dehydrogenase [Krasilnikoviella flava]
MRIGVVDLDTSHPAAFHPLLLERGHDVVAVVGGDDVATASYTAAYAAERGISRVAKDPADIVGDVDAAFVHSVDWNRHVERLRPFVEAGVGVHVCKPFAGSVADIRTLEGWAADGARITGGSALRWSASARTGAGLGPRSAYAVTFGHHLDYGIHASSLLHGIFGPGIEAARALDGTGRRAELRWNDGRTAVVDVQEAGTGYGFVATLVGDDGVTHLDATKDDLYGAFLDATCSYLAGGDLGLTFAELVEPELAVLGARASAAHGGDWIALRGDDQRLVAGDVDPDEFVRRYVATRRAALGLAPQEATR